MASFLELFAPQWTEQQRARSRQQFLTGLQQPEVFQTGDYPIAEMVKAYEHGYGMPYPTRQAPSPTAGMEGMTFSPERGQQVVQPINMPIEYIQPRTAMDAALRGAGIQGSTAGETKLSEMQHLYERMPDMEGFLGDDAGELDLPSTAGFERYPQAPMGAARKMPEQWGPISYDKYGHAYAINETTGEPKSLWGKPSEGGAGGADAESEEFKRNLDSYKAITGKVGRIDPALAMLMGQMGSEFFANPDNIRRLQGILTPLEQKILQMNLVYLEKHFRGQQGTSDPMGIR